MKRRKDILTLGRVNDAGSDEVVGEEEAWVNSLGSGYSQPHSVELPDLTLLRARLLEFTYQKKEN